MSYEYATNRQGVGIPPNGERKVLQQPEEEGTIVIEKKKNTALKKKNQEQKIARGGLLFNCNTQEGRDVRS